MTYIACKMIVADTVCSWQCTLHNVIQTLMNLWHFYIPFDRSLKAKVISLILRNCIKPSLCLLFLAFLMFLFCKAKLPEVKQTCGHLLKNQVLS
jgi:hypothetical protein